MSASAFRVALVYFLGIAPPILFAQVWPGPIVGKPFAAYFFFLWVAVSARTLGFGPALACTIASAVMLWDTVLTETNHASVVQVTRLILFLVGTTFIASVTRHKTKEAHEVEERLHALYNNAIDAIAFFDSTGRYVDVNPAAAELMGVTREEFLKNRLGDFSTSEDMRGVDKLMQRLSEEGSLDGEWTIVRKDGGTRHTSFRAVANILPGLHCVISHDITDRKNAEHSVQQLSRRLVQLQDEERRRIARQLHETTAQTLAAIRLSLARLSRSLVHAEPSARETLDDCVSLTDQAITEVRTVSYLLHPPLIEEAGLLPALRWLVGGFAKRSGIAATLDAPDEIERLPREIESVLFRVVQEALTNIQRHSGSRTARILLNRQNGIVRLQVEDEGRGLPPEIRTDADALRASGVGLAGIEQRVREFGGEMEIESHDRGTRLRVTLPVGKGLS